MHHGILDLPRLVLRQLDPTCDGGGVERLQSLPGHGDKLQEVLQAGGAVLDVKKRVAQVIRGGDGIGHGRAGIRGREG